MKAIGEVLKAYFKEQGISQEDLSRKLNVSQSYISSLFSGKTKFGKKQAQKWSEIFGFSVDFLLTGNGELSPKVNQYNENGDNIQGASVTIHKAEGDYLEIIKGLTSQLSKSQEQVSKSQEQIDRLITIIENKL